MSTIFNLGKVQFLLFENLKSKIRIIKYYLQIMEFEILFALLALFKNKIFHLAYLPY
jgi:hypothetical protein